ncbi:hypothetical protein GCM10018793_64590 [Streptomyces sulfonofaciens]|uniref:Uncharacterized protein n=1 Tax=Streptomyces sulfonofaciens TaxID=68272 RepID=A0A919GN43_9ACTN|nr:hypothetical protein [Streptomyces sulfonofaciens]GHH87694.1 hypothetical protein GCM10018793_64590 [Streptomyces sulfonofaciens]
MTTVADSKSTLTGLGPLDLEALLNGLPKATTDRQKDYNLHLVKRLGMAPCMVDLLDQYLQDGELLDLIAARSYRHVNHFDKIVLVDSGQTEGYRLTLHMWSPPYTEKELHDELIHDHRFSFWSTILTGRLVSQNFARPGSEPTGNPTTVFRQYRYSPEKLGVSTHSNFYEFVDESELEITGDTIEEQGNAYHLQYHRIHRVILPLESMTCTLVLRGPRERNFSNVYNTAYPSTDTQSTNVMFSRDELAGKLRALKDAMTAQVDALS